MVVRSVWMAIGLLAAASMAQAQYPQGPAPVQDAAPQQYSQQAAPTGPPSQALNPQTPTLEPRTGPPQRAPAPPFILTAEQQQEVDRVLQAWEQQSGRMKRFEADFTRFEYSTLLLPNAPANPNLPAHIDQGKLMYEGPDKGRFEVAGELVNGKLTEGQRAERWITDGRSIFEYNYKKKELIEHRLAAELQGRMNDGPLPFLFDAKAETLKQRYFMRVVTPQGVQGQVWLEAWPVFAGADFQRAELILTTPDMRPYALQLHHPNRDRTVFQFSEVKFNSTRLLEFLGSDPFRAITPLGWKKVVQEAPAPQVTAQPARDMR